MAYTGQFLLENLLPGLRGQSLGSNLNWDFSGGTITFGTISGTIASAIFSSPTITGSPVVSGTVAGQFLATGAIRSTTTTVINGTAGTVSVDPTAGAIFTISAGTINGLVLNAATAPVGGDITFVITTVGTATGTITFNTNFKTTATLVTGATTAKVFTVSFIGDGTNMNETGRTTAM